MEHAVRGITTYGTETRVDRSSIGRLSFYLKCCALGCGLAPDVDPRLIHYNKARFLPGQLQRAILELSLQHFSPDYLLNRVYFLDENHTVLPTCASNAFYAIEMASNLASVEHRLPLTGFNEQHHKIMLCTSSWIEEYYFSAVHELRGQARFPNSTLMGPPPHISMHCTHCRGTSDFCTCDCGCQPVPGVSACRAIHRGMRCTSCRKHEDGIRGPLFLCRTCPPGVHLCEECYESGEHDHTHCFRRFERRGCQPILVPPRVESIPSASVAGSAHCNVPIAEALLISECKPCSISVEYETPASSIFTAGSSVKLIGLSTTSMNGQQAVVLSATPERVHVRLMNVADTETYFVHPRNLLPTGIGPGDRGPNSVRPPRELR